MGLIRDILKDVDRYTHKSNWGEYKSVPLSELIKFHDAIEQRAYFAAEADKSRQPRETYWNAAKASVALEIAGEFDGLDQTFKPNNAVSLDGKDADLISFVLRFDRIQTNFHASVRGKVMENIRNSWKLRLNPART